MPEEKNRIFDADKVSDAYEKLVEVFQAAGLTAGEILVAYTNLGYTLGASIAGYKERGPSHAELERMYYEMDRTPTEPLKKMGVSLMLQSMIVASWYEDYESMLKDNQDTKEDDS